MKRILLPLSCLVALSGCWRHTREPDWNPSRDIPAGTLVRVVLQDVNEPGRISAFTVDPRAGRVIDRQDGKRVQRQEAGSVTAAQDAPSKQTLNTAVQVPCPEVRPDAPECLVYASDPKHETTGDPNPAKENDYAARLALTEKFVVQVSLNLLEAAHVTGVNVGVQGLKQAPR
ncbi:hypothetical protein [Pyxidicoccus trucidator]|uniref:hypothetical protein n=1 Tax=Pyxidicoccus trucidator TaxID=2709662 RepID=UPI0013DAF4FC|nr:hypothetical protein [Pyxidicoccus trucidator]